MKIDQVANIKMKIITPAEVWDRLLDKAPDLKQFRRRGCVLEIKSLTTESIKFLVVYGREVLFTAEGGRTLNDEWSIDFTRTN